uniref:Uncharacterized protein n=1 Tax=Rhizophora mucronata TaxID=61149 RepID=A0A2P2M6P6_RHIMU
MRHRLLIANTYHNSLIMSFNILEFEMHG